MLFNNACGEDFNLKAGREPEPAKPEITAYHVHIYFEKGKDSEKNAADTAKTLGEKFPGAVLDAHRVGRVGPHTELNIGVTITPESFGEIVGFLQMNNKGLSILIHPRTGDELVDHGDAALWLGKPVPFNQKFFDQFRAPKAKGPALH